MNIFLHEIKSYRKTTIIWTISICVILIMFISMFPNFKEGKEQFEQLLSNYDANFLKAFGVPENLFSFLSFYSYIFIYISLCGAVQAMNLGLSIISKEIRNKTADFLITKPVSRTKVITAKILSPITLLLFTNIIFISCSLLMAISLNEDFSIPIFLKLVSILPFIQLIFFALGFLIATVVSKIKNVVPLSLGIVFGFYAFGMIESMSKQENLRYLIPFKYLDSQYIIANGNYENKFLILGLLIPVVFIIASYIIYNKKDIHAV